MDVTGIIKVKFETQAVSEKFKKREFVLTVEPQSNYPQFVTFQLTQDKVTLLDSYKEGDEVKVSFNLRGREWTDKQGVVKYFNTLEAWRMEKSGTVGSNTSNSSVSENSSAPVFNADSAEDDLPF